MEVHFTPEQEARLQQIAAQTGKEAGRVIQQAVERMLEYDERFLAAVDEGHEAARWGDLLEHEHVVERIEQLLRS